MTSLQPGDIIFVKPRGLAFNLVRWFTRGKFGHVGMVAGRVRDHVMIIEASLSGIDSNDLIWRYVNRESYSVYRITKLSDVTRKQLADKALSYTGLPYDKKAILNFITGKTWFGTTKELYCSEMIYRVLISFNILKSVHHPERISPAELFKLLELKMELVKEVKF